MRVLIGWLVLLSVVIVYYGLIYLVQKPRKKNPRKISVFGLGYVGLTTAACLAELGHKVVGVDIIRRKVDMINRGYATVPVVDLERLIRKKKVHASLDGIKAIMDSDITFVCVETPTKKGKLDLTALKNVSKTIGGVLRLKDKHLIVFRSTMFPGTLDILKKILEKESGKKCGVDFDVAVNPEFLREKYAVKDFFNPCYIVVGVDNKEVGRKVLKCYEKIKSKKFIVKPSVAQMIKYANNTFHGLKVAFTNELAAVCKKKNIDTEKLMKLFCEDTDLNISTKYFRPGKAFGGSCLPKDLAVLQDNAKNLKIKSPIIQAISESNEIQEAKDKK